MAFGVGDTIETEHLCYLPAEGEEYWERVRDLYSDEHFRDVHHWEEEHALFIGGKKLAYDYREEPDGSLIPHQTRWVDFKERYPLGKGRWALNTRQDCFEAACLVAHVNG